MKKIIIESMYCMLIVITINIPTSNAQDKKIALVSLNYSQPFVSTIPVIDAGVLKSAILPITDTLVKKEKQIVDSLRIKSVDILERIIGNKIIFGKKLHELSTYQALETFPLPEKKKYGNMLLATGDKHVFPIDHMKVPKFFRKKSNYKIKAKEICEKLDIDAIVYCYWRQGIFPDEDIIFPDGEICSWLLFEYYFLGKEGDIILKGYYYVFERECMSKKEPEKLLNLLNPSTISLEPHIEEWEKPKKKRMLKFFLKN